MAKPSVFTKSSARLRESARRGALAPKKPRPYGVDPSGTDTPYSDAEFEFLRAIEAYRTRTGRRFPTNVELFHILTDELGYRR